MHERREYSPRLCGDMNQGIIIGQYADPIFIPGSLRLTPNNLLEMTRGKSLPLTLSSGAGDLKLTALYSGWFEGGWFDPSNHLINNHHVYDGSWMSFFLDWLGQDSGTSYLLGVAVDGFHYDSSSNGSLIWSSDFLAFLFCFDQMQDLV